MFKVFTGDGHQYVGLSESMAREFFESARKTGRCVMMLQRDSDGFWIEIDEHVP